MTETDTCPICLAEYTTSDTHRPASLKCGHLFGYHCLKTWFNGTRTTLCPTCSKTSKLSEIRIIYASSVKCIDSDKEKEIMDRYLSEKDKNGRLAVENAHLRMSVNLLQDEMQKLEKKVLDMALVDFGGELPHFEVFKEVPLSTSYSILLIDRANNNVFVTFRDSRTVGYVRLGYNYDKFTYVNLFDRVPDSGFIADMKISSFNDSLILVCYGFKVKLINTITENLILCIECDNRVRCASFGKTTNGCLYIGDDKGYFYVYSLSSLDFTKRLKIDSSLHSVHVVRDTIFVSSVSNWYIVHEKEGTLTCEDLNLNSACKCVYLAGSDEFLFTTIKEGPIRATHRVYEVRSGTILERKRLANIRQFSKYRNKVFKGTIYCVSEEDNSLYMVPMDQGKRHLLYKGQGKIVDFDVAEKCLIVLERNNVIVLRSSDRIEIL